VTVADWFHVTSSRNRESILRHGLDWRHMGEALGIAGRIDFCVATMAMLCSAVRFVVSSRAARLEGGPSVLGGQSRDALQLARGSRDAARDDHRDRER
jgi:hypothetical protein